MQLTYFGKLSDIAGTMTEKVTLPETVQDTGSLVRWLEDERGWSGVLSEPSIRIALNDEIISEAKPVSDADDIAFLPPVGGG